MAPLAVSCPGQRACLPKPPRLGTMRFLKKGRLGKPVGKPEETHRMILDAAASTLVRMPGASLQDIAEAAGVGRATLHRYFRKREDLIKDLATTSLEDTADAIELALKASGPAIDRLKQLVVTLLPMANRYQFLSYVWSMMDDIHISRLYNRQSTAMQDLVDACKAEGSVASGVSSRWITSVFDSLLYTAWLSLEYGEIARNDAADLVINTLLDGVGKRG